MEFYNVSLFAKYTTIERFSLMCGAAFIANVAFINIPLLFLGSFSFKNII